MVRQLLLAVSVVLCVAIGALWVCSVCIFDEISLLTHADTRYALATHPHGLDFTVVTHYRSRPPTWNPVSVNPRKEGWQYSKSGYYDLNVGLFSDAAPPIQWDPPSDYFAGIGYDTTTDNWTYSGGTQIFKRAIQIDIPFWLIVLDLTIPGVLAVMRMSRRRKRSRVGLCVFCGYDLRGSPDRCPEVRPVGLAICGKIGPFRVRVPCG